MEQCGFFDANLINGEYDRVYLAETFARYFASFIGNGVFGGVLNSLQVVSTTNPSMSILVRSGQAWINGYWYENTTDLLLEVDLADGILNRQDIVVVALNFPNREMSCYIKRGTPAISPVPPTLNRNADMIEYQLGVITIGNGVLNIKQVNIQDTRPNPEVCGFVTGVIQQIDTSTYIGQLQDFINDYVVKSNEQFANFQGSLSDVVVNANSLYVQFMAKTSEMLLMSQNEFSEFLVALGVQEDDATSEIQRLLDALQGLLEPEPAAVLSERLRVLEEEVPSELLGNVEHSLNRHPNCQLFEYNYGAGVQGAGIGPAGGETLISIPTHFEMDYVGHIRIKTKVGYGVVEGIYKINRNAYAVVFTNKLISVIMMLY